MFKPQIIVYLWLFPMFLFFIFPLFLMPVILLGEKLFAAQGKRVAEPDYATAGHGDSARADKRGYPRQRVDGIVAHVSDGVRCCVGAVSDLSREGICFVSPADKLDRNAENLGVLLTGSGKSFPIKVKPQWRDMRGAEQIIGATIVDSAGSWEDFSGDGAMGQYTAAA